jgi:luciferase family oxidoreductase group 1
LLPGRPERPEPWLLGSSPQSGLWASQAGLPYAFADFINPTGAPVATRYRREFVPTQTRREPYVIVGAAVICAGSDADAERLASSARMAFIRLHQGVLIAIPPPETAAAFLAEYASTAAALAARRRFIVGAPETVRLALDALALEYEADEVMVVTITHDHTDRLRSYGLLAEAFSSR